MSSVCAWPVLNCRVMQDIEKMGFSFRQRVRATVMLANLSVVSILGETC